MANAITSEQTTPRMDAIGTRACLLCGGDQVRTLQAIPSAAICALVKDAESLNIADEFHLVAGLEYRHCVTCDLRFFYPAVTGSERFYQQLQKLESYYQAEKPEFAFARGYLRPGHSVLEVGCGSGAFGSSLQVGSYVGLEYSEQAALAARARGLNVARHSIEDHARAHAGRYDVVCAFQVLEHVARPDLFLRACLTAAKPGGLMVISVPSADSFARGLPDFLLDLPPHHVTRWSDRCLRTVAQRSSSELLCLWHEPLQPAHRRMYAQSAILRALYGLSSRPVPIVNETAHGRAITSIARKLSALLWPLFAALPARGISVTGVYRKAA